MRRIYGIISFLLFAAFAPVHGFVCPHNYCATINCTGIKQSSCTDNQVFMPYTGFCGCCPGCVKKIRKYGGLELNTIIPSITIMRAEFSLLSKGLIFSDGTRSAKCSNSCNYLFTVVDVPSMMNTILIPDKGEKCAGLLELMGSPNTRGCEENTTCKKYVGGSLVCD